MAASLSAAAASGIMSRAAEASALSGWLSGCRAATTSARRGNVLVFADRQCAVIAISDAGWGWAVRTGRQAARKVAMQICGKYGEGCKVKQAACADGS